MEPQAAQSYYQQSSSAIGGQSHFTRKFFIQVFFLLLLEEKKMLCLCEFVGNVTYSASKRKQHKKKLAEKKIETSNDSKQRLKLY